MYASMSVCKFTVLGTDICWFKDYHRRSHGSQHATFELRAAIQLGRVPVVKFMLTCSSLDCKAASKSEVCPWKCSLF